MARNRRNRRSRNRNRREGFVPWQQQSRPPAGYYDPALDQTVRAGQRGLEDLEQDTERERGRGFQDYQFEVGDTTLSRDRGLAALFRQRQQGREQFDRTGEDLGVQRTRLGEDYGTQVQGLDRSYQRLAGRQAQSAAAAGAVPGGGMLTQAMRKRVANRAADQEPVDRQFRRGTEDLDTRSRRLGEDRGQFEQEYGETGRAAREINEDSDRRLGRLTVGFQRRYGTAEEGGDLATRLVRAGREQEFLDQDTGEARWHQARQAGYVPPERPQGEYSRRGVTYRRLGGGRYLLPSGRIVRRSGLRRLYK